MSCCNNVMGGIGVRVRLKTGRQRMYAETCSMKGSYGEQAASNMRRVCAFLDGHDDRFGIFLGDGDG